MKLQGQVEIEQLGELIQLRAFVAELLESGPLQVYDCGNGRAACRACAHSAVGEENIQHGEGCLRERARKALEGRTT